MEEKTKLATLCLFVRDDPGKVLLSRKIDGFGKGKINAYGGKFKPWLDHSLEDAAVREAEEEVDLFVEPEWLEKRAILFFYFAGVFKWEVHVFITRRWRGVPKKSDEMVEPVWYSITHMPWNEMWSGDQLWLPSVLSGDKVKASISYVGEGNHKIENVVWLPVDF